MFRRRPDPFGDLRLDSSQQEDLGHGSFLQAVVRSDGGFREAAAEFENDRASSDQGNGSGRVRRRLVAGQYMSPFRQEEHHEGAQRRRMQRYPTVSAKSAFTLAHPKELGFRTFGTETKRAKDIPFPVYLQENEARQDELLRQVQVREARLAHVKNSQVVHDYTEEGKRKRAQARAKAEAKAKEKRETEAEAEAEAEEQKKKEEQEEREEREEPAGAKPAATDDLETMDGDLGSAYTFETVPEGASYDYLIEYEQVAPGATHGPKTSKPVKPVLRTEKRSKDKGEARTPVKAKARARAKSTKSSEGVAVGSDEEFGEGSEPYLVEGAEQEAVGPETAEVEAVEPETAEPETAEPETAEPEVVEEEMPATEPEAGILEAEAHEIAVPEPAAQAEEAEAEAPEVVHAVEAKAPVLVEKEAKGEPEAAEAAEAAEPEAPELEAAEPVQEAEAEAIEAPEPETPGPETVAVAKDAASDADSIHLSADDMESEVSSIGSEPVDYTKVPRVITFPEFEEKKSKFSTKKSAPLAARPVNPLASPEEPELMVKTDREGFLSKAVYDKVKYENRKHEKWLVEFADSEKERRSSKRVEYKAKLASLQKEVGKLEEAMQEIRDETDRKIEISSNALTAKLFKQTHKYIQRKNKIFLETKAIQAQRERETAEMKDKQSDVQKEIDTLNSEKESVQREYITWSNRLAELSAHLDAKMSKLHNLQVHHANTQREIDELTQKKAALEQEMDAHNKISAENTKTIESHANKEYLPRIHEIDDKISGLLNELSIVRQESANEKVRLGKITRELEQERIAHEEQLKLEAEERKRKEADLLGKQREESEARFADAKEQHEQELANLKESFDKQTEELKKQQLQREKEMEDLKEQHLQREKQLEDLKEQQLEELRERQLEELKEQKRKRDSDGGSGISGVTGVSTSNVDGVHSVKKTRDAISTNAVRSAAKVQRSSSKGESVSTADQKNNYKVNVGRPSMESSLFEYETEEEIIQL